MFYIVKMGGSGCIFGSFIYHLMLYVNLYHFPPFSQFRDTKFGDAVTLIYFASNEPIFIFFI